MKTSAIILAAGLGTRMNSELPKVMHKIAGRPMLLYLLDTLSELELEKVVLVLGPNMEQVIDFVADSGFKVDIVIQDKRLGTGHAVKQAKKNFSGYKGNIVVLYGDSPLIGTNTIKKMISTRNETINPALVVLGFSPNDVSGYGRLMLDKPNSVEKIVEEKDATKYELANRLCNSGIIVADGEILFDLIEELSCENSKKEFYLTDVVGIARARGRECLVVEGTETELMGINSRAELAVAETITQNYLRQIVMEKGATLIDPSSVYFCYDTIVGKDVVIGPNVFFGPKVRVSDGVEIKAFCHLEGTTINKNCTVGPFARLRPGSNISEDVHIGNFVEIKNASLGRGVKVNHLSYLGDAQIGERTNIGAGTITCNYDGYKKSGTVIGSQSFVGSNTALVAPVVVGDNAIIGAGSVITKDVQDNALSLTRAEQKIIPNYGSKLKRMRKRN